MKRQTRPLQIRMLRLMGSSPILGTNLNAAVAERIMRRTSKPFNAGSTPVSCAIYTFLMFNSSMSDSKSDRIGATPVEREFNVSIV